jgi:mono/diheme cytochrome c family protein
MDLRRGRDRAWRLRRTLTGCALAAFVALGAGCGGSSNHAASTARTTRTNPVDAAKQAKLMAVGASAFKANCHSCHTLLDRHRTAPTFEVTPPNFNEVKPTKAYVKQRIMNGGIDMESFQGQLTPYQIEGVATYVSTLAGRNVGNHAGDEAGSAQTAMGQELFNQHCHACHGIAGQARTGHPPWGGTDFNLVRPSEHWIVLYATAGVEGAMPSFAKRLTSAQLRAVARYINSVAGPAGARSG